MESKGEQRFKGCGKWKKPRKRDNRKKGLKLEMLVMDALKKIGQTAGVNFLEDWTYDNNGRVDWIWRREGWELECKRFVRTQFVNVAWLRDNVVSRFSDVAERKILVTTDKRWHRSTDAEECDKYLEQNNVDVIVVGRIDRQSEYEAGVERFAEAFLELVDSAAEEELKVMGDG